MSQRNRLTTNSGETDIGSLISGDKIFTVPYFQRAYRWKSPKLQQLNADILSLVDGESDVHFLGAIIIHGRHTILLILISLMLSMANRGLLHCFCTCVQQ
jgi:uncharacterized protein with ParB-like and HNH nuclease domain